MRLVYGDDPSQWGDLHVPAGTSRGVVVVIHGGFWKQEYDLSLGRPLAQSLQQQGWAAWNIEYRRVGNGGGAPETFDDVSAAIDRLAVIAPRVSHAVVAQHRSPEASTSRLALQKPAVSFNRGSTAIRKVSVIESRSPCIQVTRQHSPWWLRYINAISHSSTCIGPPRMSRPRSRKGRNCGSLACSAASSDQELVTMH